MNTYSTEERKTSNENFNLYYSYSPNINSTVLVTVKKLCTKKRKM